VHRRLSHCRLISLSSAGEVATRLTKKNRRLATQLALLRIEALPSPPAILRIESGLFMTFVCRVFLSLMKENFSTLEPTGVWSAGPTCNGAPHPSHSTKGTTMAKEEVQHNKGLI